MAHLVRLLKVDKHKKAPVFVLAEQFQRQRADILRPPQAALIKVERVFREIVRLSVAFLQTPLGGALLQGCFYRIVPPPGLLKGERVTRDAIDAHPMRTAPARVVYLSGDERGRDVVGAVPLFQSLEDGISRRDGLVFLVVDDPQHLRVIPGQYFGPAGLRLRPSFRYGGADDAAFIDEFL